MATNGYARIGGVNAGAKLVDVNPNLGAYYVGVIPASSHWEYSGQTVPIYGYKRLKLKPSMSYSALKLRFISSDGTIGSDFQLSSQGWSDWIDIPSGTMYLGYSMVASLASSLSYSLQA